VRHSGAGHGPAGSACLSGSENNDNFTSHTVLHLSATNGVRVGGFKEQPCVIWEVIFSIYMIIVQGETVRPGSTVIRVKDNEVDYLLTHLAFWITIPLGYAAKTPSIRGPFEEDVIPNELLTCRVEKCEHGVGWWYGYCSEARGGKYE